MTERTVTFDVTPGDIPILMFRLSCRGVSAWAQPGSITVAAEHEEMLRFVVDNINEPGRPYPGQHEQN